MPDLKQFKLPDVGEGLTEADILSWRVAVGDAVEVNQVLVEIETAKAAVELPSPFAGVVTQLHCAEGDTVNVGSPLITIDAAGGAAGAVEEATPAAEQPARQPVLVGYGAPAEGTPVRRRRRNTAPAPSAHDAFNVPPAAPPPPAADLTASAPAPEPAPLPAAAPHRVLAKPPVRKLAKTLGVDLTAIPATGPNGTISREDVEAAANGAVAAPALGERETRVPIKGVRKHMAAAMVSSAFTAPHVTEFVTIDMTATMELRDRVAARPEFRDVKVSPLLFVAKAVILAAARTPEINARWDEDAGEVVLRHYVNLGVAAATDRGLIVPNVKDADRMSLRELAGALAALTDTARAGKTAPADMSGGTITITNVGVFGIDTGTPIINPGESAILAFGAVRRMPWVVGPAESERIEPRWVTQLAVSFDHRLIDGQLGSQFLADVASVLTDPGLAVL